MLAIGPPNTGRNLVDFVIVTQISLPLLPWSGSGLTALPLISP